MYEGTASDAYPDKYLDACAPNVGFFDGRRACLHAGSMLSAQAETHLFDTRKHALLEQYAGHFVIMCGRRLVGVHPSLDLALKAASDAFSAGCLECGVPILINEIGETPRVRTGAQPYTRP